ncbi:DUF7064 domain-containing protein [Mycolicibacterium helvum]|uniref:Uncharacterized protein n=1 Tax=Mycolicibacterium helvum TaxID=1534349 RepID=A0A7I7TA28_9MYCO|nr:hypothetical protein [Mycolicibacterium helvum]BBY66117.1 hypothetical protein MHEL_43600 [Mycolicibacterium helvum]
MLTAADDYPHEVGAEVNFNESMYFEFHDPALDLGGFLRLANRPNEGIGERTVCLYLPGGAVGFGFLRPTVTTNEAMNAGGLVVEVLQPMEELSIRFGGDLCVMADPRAMNDPKAALASHPMVRADIELRYRALAGAHEQTFESDGQSFAPHHYEQLCAVSGRIQLGPDRFTVAGHGLRDHSWGPRSWQAPWFYRWLHGCSAEFGFMAAYFGDPDGSSRCGGFVFDGSVLHACDEVKITTARDHDGFQQQIDLSIAAGQHHWRLRGEALSSVPLRHRNADGTVGTRIVESAIRWELADGEVLHGMAEYLDQLHDGRPVGTHV